MYNNGKKPTSYNKTQKVTLALSSLNRLKVQITKQLKSQTTKQTLF